MKKKGFTLIELLAVIVVLAIIALIATPIVMNVIKDAQKGAVERSAERYLDAVETAIATDMLQSNRVKDGIYDVDGNGNLTSEGKVVLNVAVNGDIPKEESKVAIQNGQVVKDGTNLNYGDYTVTIDDKGSAKATEKGNVVAFAICKAIEPPEEDIQVEKCGDECSEDCWEEDGEEICEEMCGETCWWEDEQEIAGVQATEASPYALGAVYSCNLGDGARTFYVLKEDGDNIKLIMNENMGETVSWCASSDKACEPDVAKAYLAKQTSGWRELTAAGGTVALPTYDDMSLVEGQTWMRTNLHQEHAYGYWTSTPDFSFSFSAWIVYYAGYLGYSEVDHDVSYGVRPVITISKSYLSL